MEQGEPFDGSVDAAMRGDYISAAEFGEKSPTLTIAKTHRAILERQKIGGDDAEGTTKKQERPVVYFNEVQGRGWVLNRTNAECMKALFGATMKDWRGKRVTLYTELVQVGPKKELGIRVKGSPDIDREVLCVVKLPKRKPVTYRLVPTGRPATEPARQREPGDDDDRDEVAR